MTEHLLEGTVTCGHGKHFVVFAAGKCYTCQMRKKIKFKTSLTTPVAVGDDVLISAAGENDGSIEEVRPRRSVLSRPTVGREDSEHVLAANIDALVIVASIDSPPLKPGLIDRFLIAAQLGNLAPVIVINKMDLHLEQVSADAIKIYQNLGYDLALTSAQDGTGLDQLARHLKDRRSILAGHSGVGKSTLLNRLLPGINLPSQDVSQVTGRGRHTTSHIEMFHLPEGGFVIDSPGIKVLGLWQAGKDGLDLYYQ
jgi:ribosome biogenesis GTPase